MVWVAWREMTDRASLLSSGALVGGLVLMTPLLPGLAGQVARGEALAAGALVAAGALGLALAAGLGASVIGADLTQKRLGFYLAQPIPGWALWGGKMLAAALLTLTACGLALLPVMVAVGGPQGIAGASGLWINTSTAGPYAAGGVPLGWPWLLLILSHGTVTVVAVAHAAGIAIRSRSRWLLLDLTGILALGYLLARTFGNLVEATGSGGLPIVLGVLAVAAPLAFLLAGALQTVLGRSDLHRGHRILSITLWGLLAPVAVTAAVYSEWLIGVEVTDLREIHEIQTSPDQGWLAITGSSPGRGQYLPAFLFDPMTGRSLRIQTSFLATMRFSRNGSRAAWIERRRGEPDTLGNIATADLGALQPAAEHLPVSAAGIGDLCLSEDGTLLGILDGASVMIFDLEDARPVLRQRSTESWFACHFVDNRRLRLFSWSYSEDNHEQSQPDLEILIGELDFIERSIEITGRISSSWPPHLQLGPALDSILAVSNDSIRLLDGVTGADLALLSADSGTGRRTAAILADGRIVVVDRSGVHLYGRQGEPFRTLSLPRTTDGRSYPVVGGQPSVDTLLVALRAPSPALFTTYLLNLESGEIEAVLDGMVPQGRLWRSIRPIETPPPVVGSLAARLLLDLSLHKFSAWTDSGLVPIIP